MSLDFRGWPSRFDMWWVAEHMSEIDERECRAFCLDPFEALLRATDQSILCWTGAIDGMPQAVFGVAPVSIGTGWGRPWFLGTDKARKEKKAFLKIAPLYLNRIGAIFPRMDNYIHQENDVAIGWLKKMGFVVDDHAVVFNGEPMLHFYSKDF